MPGTTVAPATVDTISALPQGGRKHSYVPTAGVEVYHEGSKSYWKARANVDVIIVSHSKHLCVEIIVYDPEKDREANRIYVSSILLAGKADQVELQAKLAEKKESLIRQKKLVNATQLTKDLLIQSMTNFLLHRLQITYNTPEKFEIELTPNSSDDTVVEDEKVYLDIVCPVRPTSLVPLETHFSKKFNTTDINTTLRHLQKEGAELKRATRLAELATSSVDGFKAMILEKKRIEMEMRKFSAARLRWIRSINRVMAMNYARIVRARVIKMGIYKPPADEEEHPLFQRSPIPRVFTPEQSKYQRRTIDNSMIMHKAESCPSLNLHQQQQQQQLTKKQHDNAADAIAAIMESNEKKRRSRHHMLPNIQQRKSLNTEMFQKVINGEGHHISLGCKSSEVPSLIQSYSSISQRIAPVVPLTALGDTRLPPTNQRPTMTLVKH